MWREALESRAARPAWAESTPHPWGPMGHPGGPPRRGGARARAARRPAARGRGALGALRRDFARFEDYADGFVTLCAPTAPPLYPETGDSVFGEVSSSLGAPAWSLPLLEDRGLPMGVQLVGRRGDDARLLRTARWLVEFLSNSENEGASS